LNSLRIIIVLYVGMLFV